MNYYFVAPYRHKVDSSLGGLEGACCGVFIEFETTAGSTTDLQPYR